MDDLVTIIGLFLCGAGFYALGFLNGREGLKIRNGMSRMEGVEYGIRLTNAIGAKQGEALQQMMQRQVDDARKGMGLSTEAEILASMEKEGGDKDESQ